MCSMYVFLVDETCCNNLWRQCVLRSVFEVDEREIVFIRCLTPLELCVITLLYILISVYVDPVALSIGVISLVICVLCESTVCCET